MKILRLLLLGGLLPLGLMSCSRRARIDSYLRRATAYQNAGKFDAAEIEYLNVLRLDQQNPRAMAGLGVIYFDEGLQGKCLPYLAAAERRDPTNLEVRLRIGLSDLSLGFVPAAATEAEYILQRDPRNEFAPLLLSQAIARPDDIKQVRARLNSLPVAARKAAPVLVALGNLDLLEGDSHQAETQFRQALAADPQSSAACTAIAVLDWRSKDLKGAADYFAKAAKYAPLRSGKRLQYVKFEVLTGHPDIGRAYLNQMIAAAPDFVPAQLFLAELDQQENRLPEALAADGEALRRDPVDLDALTIMGQLSLASGDAPKAVTVLERAYQIYPYNLKVRYELAQAYLAAGDAGKATDLLEQTVQKAPDFVEGVLLLARSRMQAGDSDAAVLVLNRLLESRPDVPQARMLLAQAYIGQGNLDEALDQYRRLAHDHPRSPEPFVMAGMVLAQQNKRALAQAAFEAALRLAPNYFPALQQWVNLKLADGQTLEAEGLIRRRIAAGLSPAGDYLLLGRILLARQDVSGAEAALQKAIQLAPDLSQAYFLLANTYYKAHQDVAALARLKDDLVKSPRDTRALTLKGIIEQTRSDYATAQSTYERLLALDPNSGVALNNLAYLDAENLGQLDRAYQLASKARKLLPNDPGTADTLGWILYRRRQYPWALSLLTECAAELPSEPLVQYHLGMIQYMMGDEAAARESLQRAVALSPDFDGRSEALQRLALLQIDVASAGEDKRKILEAAVARHPDDPVAEERLAALDERSGRTAAAIQAAEAALKANPSDVETLVMLGRLCASQRDNTQALAYVKKAHELAPDNPAAIHELGRLDYLTGDYQWSVGLLLEAANDEPNDPDVLCDLAEAAYSVGRVADAEGYMRQALADAPAAYPRAAECRQFLKLLRVAETPAEESTARGWVSGILKTDPRDLPAEVAMAEVERQRGDWKSAEDTYRDVLSAYPTFTPALKSLVLLYADHSAQSGVGASAFELASKAYAAFPNDPAVVKAFAVTAYHEGDYASCANALEAALTATNADPNLLFYLGMADLRANRVGEGKKALQRAIAVGLSDEETKEVRAALAKNL